MSAQFVSRDEFDERLRAVETVAVTKIEAVGDALEGRLDGLNTKILAVGGINVLGLISGSFALVALLKQLGHPAAAHTAMHAVHFVGGLI